MKHYAPDSFKTDSGFVISASKAIPQQPDGIAFSFTLSAATALVSSITTFTFFLQRAKPIVLPNPLPP
jgi:hypothetical protein